jgi:hypothetical protein
VATGFAASFLKKGDATIEREFFNSWARKVHGGGMGEYPVVAGVDDGFAAAWTGGALPQTVIRVQRFTASQGKQALTRTTH